MLTFFRSKPKVSIFNKIAVDIHSHLIPGVDDGSPDIPTSIDLIKGLNELGFKKLITTPHVFNDFYPNTSEGITGGFKTLKKALLKDKIGIEIDVAAEYYADYHLDNLIIKNDLLCFGFQKFVLFEMSFVSPTLNLDEIIFNLVSRGYIPILAHPERYSYWHRHHDVFERLQSLGCLLQLNILSLVGYYGHSVEKKAYSLLKKNQINFLGTDLHHKNHLDVLTAIQFDKYLDALFDRYSFQNKDLL